MLTARRVLLQLLLLLIATQAIAQRNCATYQYGQQVLKSFPELNKRFGNIQKHLLTGVYEYGGSITIPVAVHIVYSNDAEKIDSVMVRSQIDALNRDFAGINEDVSLVPPIFRPYMAGDCGIRFRLDTIIWKKTSVQEFVIDLSQRAYSPAQDPIKFKEKGGSNTLGCNQYLNIWSGNIWKKEPTGKSGLAGYATFPGGDCLFDGVVINYAYFGITYGEYLGLGRTGTHETGHWLNLRHLWGDAWCGDDFIEDTPTQDTCNYHRPIFPLISCSNNPDGAMFMDYMDYVNDSTMVMFTQNQKAEMRRVLMEERNSFLATWDFNADNKFFKESNRNFSIPAVVKTNIDKGIFYFDWQPVDLATGYIAEIKRVKDKEWKTLSTNSTAAIATGLVRDELYEFRVKAVFWNDFFTTSVPYVFVARPDKPSGPQLKLNPAQ